MNFWGGRGGGKGGWEGGRGEGGGLDELMIWRMVWCK